MSTSPELQEGITRDIYGMPMFVSLAVADVRAAAAWFTTALDFIELFAMPPGDAPALIHLRRWRYQDILLRRGSADAVVGSGMQLSIAATFDELDALAARARSVAGTAVEGPADTAWNTRDLTVTSPQGLRIVYTARRPEPLRDAAFSADMNRWAAEQLPRG
ncbi:VOC family protein [Microbacterium sp.]|uniref:VOC family protein n=1 Tax=Microbacterium sp. TaxID=51671 RepID=UPI002D76F415|nr:VOC family protein [Microbacterium sp.]HET6301588.1 VOC family protein [Microbacterium sp.]